jgi:Zn-dependent protease/predicted transcriptional regulator
MLSRQWQIARILGIPINVHASWLIILAFVTWSLATGYLPESLPGLSAVRYWAMGLFAALLLFVSVLLHELGHSYVALRYRVPIGQITLFVFGGMAQMRREPPGPRAEFLIALAGPVVSLVLGSALLGTVLVMDVPHGFVSLGVLLGSVNLQLALFNLIPGFPLDGGRMLRAGLWAWSGNFDRATTQAALSGQGFGLMFAALGMLLLVGAVTGFADGPAAANAGWIILIGAFLFTTARTSRRQAAIRTTLAAVSVGELMVSQVISLTSDLPLQDAVEQYFLRHGYDAFPVVEEGRPVGLLTVYDVQAVPQGLWAWRTVGSVMQPWTPAWATTPETTALAALEQMMQQGATRLAVMRDGSLVGLLTRSGLSRYLQLKGISHPR